MDFWIVQGMHRNYFAIIAQFTLCRRNYDSFVADSWGRDRKYLIAFLCEALAVSLAFPKCVLKVEANLIIFVSSLSTKIGIKCYFPCLDGVLIISCCNGEWISLLQELWLYQGLNWWLSICHLFTLQMYKQSHNVFTMFMTVAHSTKMDVISYKFLKRKWYEHSTFSLSHFFWELKGKSAESGEWQPFPFRNKRFNLNILVERIRKYGARGSKWSILSLFLSLSRVFSFYWWDHAEGYRKGPSLLPSLHA